MYIDLMLIVIYYNCLIGLLINVLAGLLCIVKVLGRLFVFRVFWTFLET